MLFRDRTDAGSQLRLALKSFYDDPVTVVLGLPRGGVPVAYEVARGLNLPLDIVCPRKIGVPGNPEFAIGAIGESGEGFFDEEAIVRLHIPQGYLEEEIARQRQISRDRVSTYRKGRSARDLRGKNTILIDDGLATGWTMRAAISTVRAEGASMVVVAIPVAPSETLADIRRLADEVVCLHTPDPFFAIGEFYSDFSQTRDEQVVALLQAAHQ